MKKAKDALATLGRTAARLLAYCALPPVWLAFVLAGVATALSSGALVGLGSARRWLEDRTGASA